MQTLAIAAGQKVRCRDREYVILRVIDLYSVLARDVNSGDPERLSVAELQTSMDLPPAAQQDRDIDLVDVSDVDWEEANRRFSVIRPVLAKGERSRERVEEAAKAAGVHWTTVYRWINAYLLGQRISALLPVRSDGGRGKGRLLPEVELVIKEMIEQYYLTLQQRSIDSVIQEVASTCRERGLPVPSGSSVARRIGQIEQGRSLSGRRGRRAAQELFAPQKAAPVPGTILAEAQIDHCLLDIIVVDSEHRLPIGRPWLTVLLDVTSRMVLGFYVSLDPPGSIGTGLCISRAVLPKEKWLKKLRITANWPCWGFPKLIGLDNAMEFRGEMLTRACQEHGMTLRFRKVKQPRYGAHIERLMGTVDSEIHLLPGTTLSNPEARGEYDSEGKAVFTIDELEEWLALWITTVYHRRLHRGIGRTPLGVWEEGILGTKDTPGIGIPPRVTDEARLVIDFMPSFERTVQPYGIEWNRVRYDDDVLRRYVGSRDPANRRQPQRFRFHYDPRDVSILYFNNPAAKRYVSIGFRDRSHPPVSMWELRAAKRSLLDAGRKEVNEQALFEAVKHLRRKTDEASYRTKTARHTRERRRKHSEVETPLIQDVADPHPVGDLPEVDARPTERSELKPYDEHIDSERFI
jgi:putative transposase